jgi:hypothetical protein
MARTGSRVKKRTWKKVVVTVMAGIVAIGSLIFWKRYDIALRYMERNKTTQEMVILFMLEKARPMIEKEIQMNLPEKILSAIAGRRNEKERQTDALQDVREFAELGFENHRLNFINVHNIASVDGFKLHGFDFALGWNREKTNEVLAEFNVHFLKRKIGEMQINSACSFFTELRNYVEKKAREK